jgi:hypothetical protein
LFEGSAAVAGKARVAEQAFRSSKFQHPDKNQAPNTKHTADARGCFEVGAWNLKFVWNLDVGIWSFAAAHFFNVLLRIID